MFQQKMFEGLEQFLRSTIDGIERKFTGATVSQGDVKENQELKFEDRVVLNQDEILTEDVDYDDL